MKLDQPVNKSKLAYKFILDNGYRYLFFTSYSYKEKDNEIKKKNLEISIMQNNTISIQSRLRR